MGIDGVMARIHEIMDRIWQLEGRGRRQTGGTAPSGQAPARPEAPPGDRAAGPGSSALKGPEFRKLLEQLLAAQSDLAQSGGSSDTAGLLSGLGEGGLGSLLGLAGEGGAGALGGQGLEGALGSLLGSGAPPAGSSPPALQDYQRLLLDSLLGQPTSKQPGSAGGQAGAGSGASSAGGVRDTDGSAQAAREAPGWAGLSVGPEAANAPEGTRPPEGAEAPRVPDSPRPPTAR